MLAQTADAQRRLTHQMQGPCAARPFGRRSGSRRIVNPRFPGADVQATRAKFRPGCPKFCRPAIGELLAPGWPDRKAQGASYAGWAVSGSVGVSFEGDRRRVLFCKPKSLMTRSTLRMLMRW